MQRYNKNQYKKIFFVLNMKNILEIESRGYREDTSFYYYSGNNTYRLYHFFTTRQGPLWHRIVVKNTLYKTYKNNTNMQNAYYI